MGLARAFFEDVRRAAIDAERCRQQLEALEARAKFGVGSGYHGRVQTSGNGAERCMVAYVHQHELLEARRDRDFALIDKACAVLYGPDQMSGGLCALNQKWADTLWWRFCTSSAWKQVSAGVGFSIRQCQTYVNDALRALDKMGLVPSEW